MFKTSKKFFVYYLFVSDMRMKVTMLMMFSKHILFSKSYICVIYIAFLSHSNSYSAFGIFGLVYVCLKGEKHDSN